MYKLVAVFFVSYLASESMANLRLRRQDVPPTEAAQVQPASASQNVNMEQCLVSCPVTPEYNPVCGSNGRNYSNPGRLLCDQACGENVSLLRTSPCPAATS